MLYTVNSNFKHCLSSELPSSSTRVRHTRAAAAAHLWVLKYQGVERLNLLGLSCLLRFECRRILPTLCLTPERWMGSRAQSTVGSFPELCFLFRGTGASGVAKEIYKQLCLPTWASGFNNNNKNNSII